MRAAGRGALAGLVSAALLLGTASAVAALVGRGSDPFLAVGDLVVRFSPKQLTRFAIDTFGSYDKLVLFVGHRRRPRAGRRGRGGPGHAPARRRASTLPVLLVLAAGAAVLPSPGARAVDLVPLLVGTVVGAAAFVGPGPPGPPRPPRRPGDAPATAGDALPPPASRRLFLAATGGAALAAAGLAGARPGARDDRPRRRRLARRADPAARPATPSPTCPPAPSWSTAPRSAPRTPTSTASTPRSPSPASRPRTGSSGSTASSTASSTLTWDRLTRTFDVVDREITMVCVSNPVGGDLAGNAVWRGVRLADVLAEAGVDPSADMVLSTSVDGWTASTPLASLVDSDDALLAFGMNGEPLPFEHGFPVRMVVPGLYGYVSATKWVVDLEVTRFADDEAYWTPRGYAAEAPVKTASRIEVPASFEQLPAGTVVVAGTAWHPGLGVDAVEVRVDGGEWQQADLGEVPGPTTWRQWRWEWDAEPGQHTLEVRATDADGVTQTDERAEIAPDGSTGWHSVVMTVTQP